MPRIPGTTNRQSAFLRALRTQSPATFLESAWSCERDAEDQNELPEDDDESTLNQ